MNKTIQKRKNFCVKSKDPSSQIKFLALYLSERLRKPKNQPYIKRVSIKNAPAIILHLKDHLKRLLEMWSTKMKTFRILYFSVTQKRQAEKRCKKNSNWYFLLERTYGARCGNLKQKLIWCVCRDMWNK